MNLMNNFLFMSQEPTCLIFIFQISDMSGERETEGGD
jgi:hypothetical protein